MPSSSSKYKPKPSEVASEAKKQYIPLIRRDYASVWTTCSYIYQQPLLQINFDERLVDLSPPLFCERLSPFICLQNLGLGLICGNRCVQRRSR
jgi:hypothetical protein